MDILELNKLRLEIENQRDKLSNKSKEERKEIERRGFMRHMILGEEYQPLPTRLIPNSKIMEEWEGVFFQLIGRKMTEGEFMLFSDKYDDKETPNGYGIKTWIKENDIKLKEKNGLSLPLS